MNKKLRIIACQLTFALAACAQSLPDLVNAPSFYNDTFNCSTPSVGFVANAATGILTPDSSQSGYNVAFYDLVGGPISGTSFTLVYTITNTMGGSVPVILLMHPNATTSLVPGVGTRIVRSSTITTYSNSISISQRFISDIATPIGAIRIGINNDVWNISGCTIRDIHLSTP